MMIATVWRVLVCCLLFLILREWLQPLVTLSYVTELYVIKPLLLAIICFIVCDMLRLSQWVGWPLKVLISLSIIAYYFHDQFIVNIKWWGQFIEIVKMDMAQLWQRSYLFSAEIRTFIFLIGLALMISVVQSLALTWQMGGYFVTATLLYLTTLQLVGGVDTSAGIMRVTAYGLLLLLILHMARIQRTYHIANYSSATGVRWLVIGLLVAGLTWGTGAGLSQTVGAEGQVHAWATEWLSNYSRSKQTFNVSGYGGQTERLGGKLVLNDEIAFIAAVEGDVYWRGDSKNHYTGQGWKDVSTDEFADQGGNDRRSDELTGQEVAELTKQGWNHVPSNELTGQEVDELTGQGRNDRLSDELTGQEVAELTEQGWNHVPSNELSGQEVDEPHDIGIGQLAAFLQLPDSLPERISQLTSDVVGDEHDPLRQVRAVESFLKTNYIYSLDQPDFPGDGQDFVDHFLFIQGLGYCDHFSTAMVVMLRTLGIPARWVIGYATGEHSELTMAQLQASIPDESKHHTPSWLEPVAAPIPVLEFDTGQDDALMVIANEHDVTTRHVIVRQSHAHSWVEAYLPELGWQAFEPTPSAGSEALPTVQGETATTDQASAESSLWSKLHWQQWLEPVTSRTWMTSLKDGGMKVMIANGARKLQDQWQAKWVDGERGLLIVQGTIAVVFLAAWVYLLKSRRLRARWHLWMQLRKLKRNEQRGEISVRLFEGLWLRLFHRYGAISSTQTMREYVNALQLNSAAKREALHHFLELYETVRYNSSTREIPNKSYIMQVWKKIG